MKRGLRKYIKLDVAMFVETKKRIGGVELLGDGRLRVIMDERDRKQNIVKYPLVFSADDIYGLAVDKFKKFLYE